MLVKFTLDLVKAYKREENKRQKLVVVICSNGMVRVSRFSEKWPHSSWPQKKQNDITNAIVIIMSFFNLFNH